MDEQQFRKNMIKLRSLAKSQGDRISKEQVKRMFLPLNMEEGHFLLIYRYLDEEKVKVFETDSELDESSNDKKASSLKMNSDDSEYLKMYIEELNLLDIPSKESRSLIIEEILKLWF